MSDPKWFDEVEFKKMYKEQHPEFKSQRNDILNTNLPTMQSAKKSHKFDIDEIKCKLWWLALLGLYVGLAFTITGLLVTYSDNNDPIYEFWAMTVVGILLLLGVIVWMYDKDYKTRWVWFTIFLFLGLLFIILGICAVTSGDSSYWGMIGVGIALILVVTGIFVWRWMELEGY